jgi:hypothetical protein
VRGDDDTSEDPRWVREAEAARRDGRASEARRLAEVGLVEEPFQVSARIVLALACLDLGDDAAAREALLPALAGLAPAAAEPLALDAGPDEPFAVQNDPLADLAENELERAFDRAEAEPVEAWTTNRVAEAALRAVEAEPEAEEDAAPFATETVARLYESQGDAERARAIRRSLGREPEGGVAADAETRERWVGTLERWLDNLRRASR